MDNSPSQNFLSTIKTYDSCLGQGAFGIVLKAIDISGTPTAVKFMFPPDEPIDPRSRLRECIVSKQLEPHKNIIRILEFQEKTFAVSEVEDIFQNLPHTDRNSPFMITCLQKANLKKTIESICIQMELCGLNLRNWLKIERNENWTDVKVMQKEIVTDLVSGLRHLHRNKIIHRDLKPENVMFASGRFTLPVKIGDFGHSRIIHSDDSVTGPLTEGIGTRSYMAPEVYNGDYSQQADLYSLGLVMWEVVQLIGLNTRNSLFDRLVNDKEEDLVHDHSMMTGIKYIIIGLTKRQVSDRIKSLNEVNTDNWNIDCNVRPIVAKRKILPNPGNNSNSSLLYPSPTNMFMPFPVPTSTQRLSFSPKPLNTPTTRAAGNTFLHERDESEDPVILQKSNSVRDMIKIFEETKFQPVTKEGANPTYSEMRQRIKNRYKGNSHPEED